MLKNLSKLLKEKTNPEEEVSFGGMDTSTEVTGVDEVADAESRKNMGRMIGALGRAFGNMQSAAVAPVRQRTHDIASLTQPRQENRRLQRLRAELMGK